jgi:hypothetical protein
VQTHTSNIDKQEIKPLPSKNFLAGGVAQAVERMPGMCKARSKRKEYANFQLTVTTNYLKLILTVSHFRKP